MADAYRLFLVEDDEDTAFLMERHLNREGHQVTVCRNGSDALIVLGQVQFDLAIIDFILPDMHGTKLVEYCKEQGYCTPTLIVTGFGDQQLAADVLRAGALDYVVKDNAQRFLEELPKRVAEAVKRHQLQESNDLLVAAFESARDGIVITDVQGTVLRVNRALESMFGYERSEVIGKTVRMFGSSKLPAEFFDAMWRNLLDQKSWQGEFETQRKNQARIEASLTFSPIVSRAEQITHFVGIFRDISERKHMERQLFHAQKMHSVGTLAGGIAHEFNNLLAGIQGYASLGLREKGLSADLRDFLGQVVDLSERAAYLTRQLLTFARKPTLTRQPTQLETLLATTRDLATRSLKIEVEVQSQKPPDVTAFWRASVDGNLLQQALINLSVNARDAMPHPQPAPVIYRLRHASLASEMSAFPQSIPKGDYVVVDVLDQGSGMPPEVLAQAVDPFFTTKEVGKGTGLGLPVVFGIMTAHQGYLAIESEAGRGTCMSLYLPRLDEDKLPADAPKPRLSTISLTTIRRRVLVIDDEPAVRDVICRYLEIAAHSVLKCASGQEACSWLKTDSAFDIILLDLLIPREEGVENFRRIRQLKPSTPVLLCTGTVQVDAVAQLLAEPNVSLLRKPFRMDELWDAIQDSISKVTRS